MTTQKQPAVPVSGIASWCEILVPDLDAAEGVLDQVRAAGGDVRDDRTPIGGDYGWYATVADPFGNPIGLTTATPAG
ncbi:MAG: hypothetical protein WKF45_09780 [Ilumatobacteraceae bacterium]